MESKTSNTLIEGFTGEFSFLSNFHEATITPFDGITYPTVEHAYQAFKTENEDVRKKIASLSTPGKAKRYGRQLEINPAVWDAIKDCVMFYLLRLKFELPVLRSKLLSLPYPVNIVETNFWGDTYWGVCNGEGSNRLGTLLSSVRGIALVADDIRQKQLDDYGESVKNGLVNVYKGDRPWNLF